MKRYTPDEDHYIREMAPVLPLAEVAAFLGRSEASLKDRMGRLGVTGRPRGGHLKTAEQQAERSAKMRFNEWGKQGVQKHGPLSQNWKGGNDQRRCASKAWVRLRKEVLARDEYLCQRCKFFAPSGRGLHVHHLVPVWAGGLDTMENLLTLCVPCHASAPEHRRI